MADNTFNSTNDNESEGIVAKKARLNENENVFKESNKGALTENVDTQLKKEDSVKFSGIEHAVNKNANKKSTKKDPNNAELEQNSNETSNVKDSVAVEYIFETSSDLTSDASDSDKNDEKDEEISKSNKKNNFSNVKENKISNKSSEESASITPIAELRNFKRIPLFIVEYHNDVLQFILDSVGSRFLPLERNTLLHFDSHPDMVISRELQATDAFKKDTLLDECSIESWIMPLCYTGVITRIIWIKYPWCQQLPTGIYNFNIGDYLGTIHVDLALPYFLSEGTVCHSSQLSNIRRIELIVIDAIADGQQSILNDFLKDSVPYILDIDLDFFSTKNPFLDLYTKFNYYEDLKEIFALNIVGLNEENASKMNCIRSQQLNNLKEIFEHLSENDGNLENFKTKDYIHIKPLLELMENFAKKMLQNYEPNEIDWMQLYDAGCTSDSGGLPSHVSTPAELSIAYENFSRILMNLPHDPIAITISRSSEDEYCPSDQVEHIQENVLKALNHKFCVHKPIRADQTRTTRPYICNIYMGLLKAGFID